MLIPDPRRTPLPNLISHNGVILYQWEFLRARLDEGEGLPWFAMEICKHSRIVVTARALAVCEHSELQITLPRCRLTRFSSRFCTSWNASLPTSTSLTCNVEMICEQDRAHHNTPQ